jgi:hypothetical protein
MKPEELMIGDWVMYEGHSYQIRQLGIYGEDRDGNDYPAVCIGKPQGIGLIVERSEISPIPITPEILEKNGFVIKKKWAQFGNFGDSPLIMWHFEDDKFLHNYKHELEIHQNDTGKVHVTVPCEYIHQLQQIMRICGINKEIYIY